jgi:hypothetical protein
MKLVKHVACVGHNGIQSFDNKDDLDDIDVDGMIILK